MDNIINVVKDYLTRETNNALLITGEWGVGKTYFFENTLSKKIEEISIKEDENVKYTPIRISLFGVTSINDIEKRIILEIYPLLKNKVIKIGKLLLNVILSTPIAKELTRQVPKNIIKLANDYNTDIIKSRASSLVICFDDLERKSKTFSIDSLIGYINNLSENSNLKIIIIGNTDKIKENFNEIKEKLIGREIEYKINIEEVFDTLIHNEFKSFSGYTEFLQKEKNFICSFFQDYKNIRTLKFILTRYHDIHSQIEIIAPNIEYIQSNKNTVLKDALLFTIAISIEHKGGNVTRNSKDEIDNTIRFSRKDLEKYLNKQSSYDNDEEETILEKIKSKYYNQNNLIYYFYESIFDYIIGINTLDENLLRKDILNKYKVTENNSIPECYEVYNKINSDYILQISNKKYIELLNEVLQYVDEGKYHLESYGGIYIHIIKYNNPLGIDKETLKNRIIDGIKKGKNNFEYNPELPNKLLYSEDPDIDENIKEIVHFCININKEKEKYKYKKEAEDLINDLNNNFDHFEHKVKRKYNNIPIFAYINSKTISDFYYNNIPLREKISKLIKERAILVEEKEFYSHLQQSIKEKEEELQSGPEWYSYNKFNKLLKKIIDIAK